MTTLELRALQCKCLFFRDSLSLCDSSKQIARGPSTSFYQMGPLYIRNTWNYASSSPSLVTVNRLETLLRQSLGI